MRKDRPVPPGLSGEKRGAGSVLTQDISLTGTYPDELATQRQLYRERERGELNIYRVAKAVLHLHTPTRLHIKLGPAEQGKLAGPTKRVYKT